MNNFRLKEDNKLQDENFKMRAEEVWIVRHGQTEFNKKQIIQGSGVDSDLNDMGKYQALRFYEHYRDENFDFLYYSNLKRTQQTIQPFLDLGIQHLKTALIDEISWGIHEGKSYDPRLVANYQELIGKWAANDLEASLPEGESAKQLMARLQLFLNTYIFQNSYKKVLICSHGRSIRALLTLFNNEHPREMEKYAHHNTGLFLLKFNNQLGNYVLVKNNNIEHLEK